MCVNQRCTTSPWRRSMADASAVRPATSVSTCRGSTDRSSGQGGVAGPERNGRASYSADNNRRGLRVAGLLVEVRSSRDLGAHSLGGRDGLEVGGQRFHLVA